MKRLVKILLAVLIFNCQLSIVNSAQAQIGCKMTKKESCKPGKDGEAKITGMTNKMISMCSIEWVGPDGQKLVGINPIGMKAGAWSVTVKALACNKIIYQDICIIDKEDACKIYASISQSTQDVPCNVQPTATLTANAWGGTPPYKYTWKTKTVSSSGTYGVTVTDSNGFVGSAKVSVSLKMTKCPEDPNEIDGPVGYGDDHLVSTDEKMRYTILYENSPEFASAPASLVNIVYPIPPEHNINSVRLSDFGFGSYVFTVPSNTTAYTQRLDVSDSLGVWVDVTAGIDMAKNQVFWNLQSVDPATGFEPASADLGFLLVNDSLHHGEGYVSFSVAPKNDVTSGDTVAAEATIVFNENTAISTNVWTNTFDAIAPTSALHAEIKAEDSTACDFTFTANDDLSGVDNVELLVSLNGEAYSSVGYFALTDTAHYTIEDGYVYRFISRATDNVGNQEPLKNQPDTLINNNTAPVDILLSNNSFAENATLGTLVGTLATIDNDITKPFVYELVSGEGDYYNSSFYIEGNGLYTGSTYACTGNFDYSVRIRTTDITGLSFEKDFELKSIQQNFPYSKSSNESICQGSSYQFGNRYLIAAGTYTDSLTTAMGCDSIITVNLTVYPTSYITAADSICEYQPFTWIGHNKSYDSLEAGHYFLYDTMNTVMGCDSTFVLSLTVNATSASTETQDVCDSYTWNDTTYTASGTKLYYTTNISGCDSVATLNLTIRHSSSSIDTVTDCDSYTWHGMTYTGGGTNVATYTTTNAVGCDSVVTLNLTINHSNTGTETVTVCDSFYWNGTTYTSSTNTPSFTGINAAGCDSVVTLNLTINYSSAGTETQDVCDSYIWHDTTFTASGTHTHQTTNAAGCDSVATLNLTIRHSSAGSESQDVCDSYTWNDTTFTVSGTHTYHTTNAAGCDSVATLYLTVRHSSSYVETVTVCDSFYWNGTTYTSSTSTPSFTGINAEGCDSVATLNLTINYSSAGTETQDVCNSYTWNDTTFTASGTHTYHTTNAAGCDSVATLNLTIRHSSAGNETQDVCDSYTWNDSTYTASGTHTYLTTNAADCDSVATLYLTVRHSSSYVETVTVCDSFYWNGTTYTSSTSTPSFTGINAAGCDSVATLNLTINYSSAGTETQDVCDSYTWNGTTYTSSTSTPSYTSINAAGCDSVTTLNLTIRHSSSSTETQDICDSYTWNDSTYTASGTHIYQTANTAGCDSVATLNLTIRHSSSYVETAVVCDSFYWNGTTYTNSTSIPSHTGINAAGCDSVVTLNLTINYSNTAIETVTACDSFDWYGTTYTSSTSSPSHTNTNAAGCDSVTTLNLTIRFSNTGNETVTACDSYDWYGTTYTSSTNTPTHTSINVAGCDSVVTLHLTVNYSNTGDTTAISCDSYDWYGTTYTSSTSTPTHTSMNAVGCDSVVTLHLTINHSVTVYDSLSLSSTEIPYDYHGNTVNVAGDYTFEGTTTQGCDSTTMLHVEVIAVGLDAADPLAGLKVYPNPTHGTLTIDADDVLMIEVFDLAGRKVASFESKNSIEITELASGTYTLRIKTARGETLRRIVKK